MILLASLHVIRTVEPMAAKAAEAPGLGGRAMDAAATPPEAGSLLVCVEECFLARLMAPSTVAPRSFKLE